MKTDIPSRDADRQFLALADIESPLYDKQSAKKFAIANFTALSENSKFLFYHIFPTYSEKAFPVTSPEPGYVSAGFTASDVARW